jgi:DDE superfamily endonuclease
MGSGHRPPQRTHLARGAGCHVRVSASEHYRGGVGGDLRCRPDQAIAEFRPSAEEAAEATKGTIALVDGTLWPCWSWAGERELWAGKYKTTGHGSLIVTNLAGRVTFVSEPVAGKEHDMAKLRGSECEIILQLAGDAIGDKGFMGTDYIITPVRKLKRV